MGNKVYFAISDVHSFYQPMIDDLYMAGFDKNNPDHILILCGDAFDRGDDTLKVYKFLKSLPKDRRILIRGNHEILLRECYERGFYYKYDMNNGTLKTMCHLAGTDPDWRYKYYEECALGLIKPEDADAELKKRWDANMEAPFKSRKIKNLLKWIDEEWVDYFRLGKYVFVHAWIPVKHQKGFWEDEEDTIEYDADWESRPREEWEYASWLCPWKAYLRKLGPSEGDVIVCGHWHVQDFHTHLEHDVDGYKNREIYFSDRLIALDAMTAQWPHLCNVLVIDGDKCYDRHGNVLN